MQVEGCVQTPRIGSLPACPASTHHDGPPADHSQQICYNNNVGLHDRYNCAAGDTKCLCASNDFNFGIRDCAVQNCVEPGYPTSVIAAVSAFCASKYCQGFTTHDTIVGTSSCWDLVADTYGQQLLRCLLPHQPLPPQRRLQRLRSRRLPRRPLASLPTPPNSRMRRHPARLR